ncbi:hypothetical protein D3C87_1993010 [compost metagenome]
MGTGNLVLVHDVRFSVYYARIYNGLVDQKKRNFATRGFRMDAACVVCDGGCHYARFGLLVRPASGLDPHSEGYTGGRVIKGG